jgi:hypothetical protein
VGGGIGIDVVINVSTEIHKTAVMEIILLFAKKIVVLLLQVIQVPIGSQGYR